MKYTADQFYRLETLANEQGGANMTEKCTPRRITKLDEKGAHGRINAALTTGCDTHSKFVLPYERVAFGDKGTDQIEDGRAVPVGTSTGMLTICARDDNMGMWPRFMSAMEDE